MIKKKPEIISNIGVWSEVGTKETLPNNFTEPEGVLMKNQFLYIFNSALSLNETNSYAIFNLKSESFELKNMEINGFRPLCDGVQNIYLFTYETGPHSDFRYQMIEFNTQTNNWDIVQTSGISPKRRSDFNAILIEEDILFFGGLQMYGSDSTGSLVYCLNLPQKEWTTIDYVGNFPASISKKPYLGNRGGMTATLVNDSSILCFGGTTVAHTPLSEFEDLATPILKYVDNNDMYDFNLEKQTWNRISPFSQELEFSMPRFSNHTAILHYNYSNTHRIIFWDYRNLYSYDLLSNKFSKCRNTLFIPKPIKKGMMHISDNTLYIIGVFKSEEYEVDEGDLLISNENQKKNQQKFKERNKDQKSCTGSTFDDYSQHDIEPQKMNFVELKKEQNLNVGGINVYKINVGYIQELNKEQINMQFVDYFNHKPSSDCRFEIKNKQLFLHKQILARFSEHFYHMFLINDSDFYIVSDFSYETFFQMMKQIYTQFQEPLSQNFDSLLSLLRAAFHYKLPILQQKIEKLIIISESNVQRLFKEMETIKVGILQKRCTNFILENLDHIIEKRKIESINCEIVLRLMKRFNCNHANKLKLRSELKGSSDIQIGEEDEWMSLILPNIEGLISKNQLDISMCMDCHKLLNVDCSALSSLTH